MAISSSLLSILILGSVQALLVEVEERENNYQLLFEGEAQIHDNELIVSPMQIIKNNLTPQQSISDLLYFEGYKVHLKLQQLHQFPPMTEQFSSQNHFYWISNNRINLRLVFSKSSTRPFEQEIYHFIRNKTEA